MSKNCIFCKIAREEIKEEFLYEDDDIFVVRDIHPRTPTHLLIVTKEHYSGFSQLVEANPELIGRMAVVVEKIVDQLGLRDKSKWGYTWGFHCGGKESVAHVHAQLLAEMKKDELVL